MIGSIKKEDKADQTSVPVESNYFPPKTSTFIVGRLSLH